MFKNVIAPVQAWLLSQGRCGGCGRELAEAKSTKLKNGTKKITCDCGRIFIMEKNNKYRRALIEEV
jgi:predicted  nucleic acid-binding Zn-ribbon protein